MNTWLVFSYIYCPHGSGFFKILGSCYSWEVMRGKMLQRDTLVHGGILEPVHYMHYIFFLQAHLNRIYQVWNLRGTEMYRSSVAKYASRFDKTLDWNQIIPFFIENFPAVSWKPQGMISSDLMKLIRLLHASQIQPTNFTDLVMGSVWSSSHEIRWIIWLITQ